MRLPRVIRTLGLPLICQGFQSVANFATIGIVARLSDASSFGGPATAWLAYSVLLAGARTLLGEQVIVERARGGSDDILGANTAGSALVGAIGGVVAAGILYAFGDLNSLAITLVITLLLFNDGLRYRRMADNAYGRLIASDALLALGCLSTYTCTFISHSTALRWIPVVIVLAVIMTNSPAVPSVSSFLRLWARLGTFRTWGLAQVLLVNSLAQLTPIILSPIMGKSAFGGLRAVQTIVVPLAVFATALQPIIIRHRASLDAGPFNFKRSVCAPALAYFSLAGLLSLFATQIVRFGIGNQYRGYSDLVLPTLCSIAVLYVGLPGGVELRVLRLGREIAIAQFTGVLLGFIPLLIFTEKWGAQGAAWGSSVQSALCVAFAYAYLTWSIRTTNGTRRPASGRHRSKNERMSTDGRPAPYIHSTEN